MLTSNRAQVLGLFVSTKAQQLRHYITVKKELQTPGLSVNVCDNFSVTYGSAANTRAFARLTIGDPPLEGDERVEHIVAKVPGIEGTYAAIINNTESLLHAYKMMPRGKIGIVVAVPPNGSGASMTTAEIPWSVPRPRCIGPRFHGNDWVPRRLLMKGRDERDCQTNEYDDSISPHLSIYLDSALPFKENMDEIYRFQSAVDQRIVWHRDNATNAEEKSL
ncbi:hypothetical protein FAGAP_8808 [Fusarium agapanthi]|uniref:Uncharacterized protein n=1 Tax=Fusarium agapanthi TaxID=1803897 RepID=A0A9P5B5L6_9HYPO|nr:hypothetical protein FAGAP_8808 [Fusarium agapanthi]